MLTMTIPHRFRGPPNSGNGGYVCGMLARNIAGAAEVTLRAPYERAAVDHRPPFHVLADLFELGKDGEEIEFQIKWEKEWHLKTRGTIDFQMTGLYSSIYTYKKLY